MPNDARDPQWLLLRQAYGEARGHVGPLELPFDAFAAKVLERVRARIRRAGLPAEEHTGEALRKTALSDLYLAVACEAGDDRAWKTLSQRFLPPLKQVVVRRGATADEAEEIVNNLPGDLVAPTSGGPPRIARYDGSGSLYRWLATVVLRRHADRLRQANPTSLDSDIDERLPPPGARSGGAAEARDPAERALDAEAGECLREALEDSFEKLTRREYLAVHFKFRAGLPQRRIAPLLGTDEPGLSRILGRAVEKIRDAVKRRVDVDGGPDADGQRWQALKEALEIQLQESRPDRDSLRGGATS